MGKGLKVTTGVRVYLIALILSVLLQSCRPAEGLSSLSEEETNWLRLNGEKIEVLFGYDSPPNGFYNNQGEYVGLFVDYFHEIERLMGTQIPIRYFDTWSDLMTYAGRGRNFIIVGINPTESRKEYLSFTSSIVKIPSVIVSRSENKITSFDDKDNKVRAATVKNYSIANFLKKIYPTINLSEYRNELEGIQAVNEGEVDAMVLGQISAVQIIAEQGFSNLTISGELPNTIIISAATSSKDWILFRILDKAVDRMEVDRKDELYRTWAGFNSFWLSPNNVSKLITIVSLTLFFIVFLWLWLFLLKREISRNTKLIKQQERELVRVKHLESLAAMAGRISHDFNNLLMGIQSYMDLARSTLNENDPSLIYLDKALNVMDRTSHLTNQFKVFSSEKKLELKTVNLVPYLKDIIDFLSADLSFISYQFDFPENLWKVIIDSKQMEQAITNLLINAGQAMPGGGSIIIRGNNTREKHKPYVELIIEDNGSGISEEDLEHIFEPYFTKKENGTGLGLASVYYIVLKHEGEIRVRSELSKGSCFTIKLPAAE